MLYKFTNRTLRYSNIFHKSEGGGRFTPSYNASFLLDYDDREYLQFCNQIQKELSLSKAQLTGLLTNKSSFIKDGSWINTQRIANGKSELPELVGKILLNVKTLTKIDPIYVNENCSYELVDFEELDTSNFSIKADCVIMCHTKSVYVALGASLVGLMLNDIVESEWKSVSKFNADEVRELFFQNKKAGAAEDADDEDVPSALKEISITQPLKRGVNVREKT